MDDRYPVAIGYPNGSTPSGMHPTPRLRGHLSTEHFRKWGERLVELAQADTAMVEELRSLTLATIPPTNYMTSLFDVMIKQRVDDGDGYVTVTGSCSLQSIVILVEFLKHWNAVEDELEAEMESDWTP